MDKETLDGLVANALSDVDVMPEDIPDFSVYADQILDLMTKKRLESSPHFHDRVWTKTMINNYSKNDLISRIDGKKYGRRQLLDMLFIYNLKNTLSIAEIKQMKTCFYDKHPDDTDLSFSVYDRFLTAKKNLRQDTADKLASIIEQIGLDLEKEEDRLLLIATLSAASSYFKDLTEVFADHFYPIPPESTVPTRKNYRKGKRELKRAYKESAKTEKVLYKTRKRITKKGNES